MKIFGEFELQLIVAGICILVFVLVNLAALFKFIFFKMKKQKEEVKHDEAPVKKHFLKRFYGFVSSYGLIILNLFLISVFLYMMHLMFYPSPKVIRTYPNATLDWVEDRRPIEIEFSRPIKEGVLETYLNSEVAGTWVYEKSVSFLPFVRLVKFFPDETFPTGEGNFIYLVNFDQRDIGEYQFNFDTAKMPGIKSITPIDGEKNVQINRIIEIELDSSNGRFVEWDFQVTPKLDFQTKFVDDKHIQLIPDGNLKQTQKYTIEILRTPQTYSYKEDRVIRQGTKTKIHESFFTTVKAPLIESYSPKDSGVKVDVPIVIKFDTKMVKEDVEKMFKIEPSVEGVMSWDDDRTFRFVPNKPLEKATKYKITLEKGLKDSNGGITETEIVIEFETVGKVKVISFSPANGAQNGDVDGSIFVKFDQEVAHASAQSKFSIAPNVAGAFSWEGNTMIFNPNGQLTPNANYTVTIAAGVKTVHGIDSDQAFTATFKTQPSAVILNVQRFGQNNSYGCNCTAFSMITNYKGVATGEYNVINNAGQGPQGNNGNPHKGWVANYGIYWEPLLSYAQSLGFSGSYYRTNWNLTSLLNEVKNGNPVLIWYQNGGSTPFDRSYTATDGTPIFAVNGMHSIVIVGYEGTPENPTGVYILDPYWYSGLTLFNPQTLDFVWGNWYWPGRSPVTPPPVPASHRRAALVIK